MSDRSPLLVHRPAMSSLALICAAQFVLQLDFSIVNVALPSMQQQFHVPAANLQWVVTGYALTFDPSFFLVVEPVMSWDDGACFSSVWCFLL